MLMSQHTVPTLSSAVLTDTNGGVLGTSERKYAYKFQRNIPCTSRYAQQRPVVFQRSRPVQRAASAACRLENLERKPKKGVEICKTKKKTPRTARFSFLVFAQWHDPHSQLTAPIELSHRPCHSVQELPRHGLTRFSRRYGAIAN